ncbi:hypothetical protein SAMN02910276_01994 [Butyrivibrio sp. Su6]|uniref:hypothetical protein n=1 Tax=Butyrivibrio sp. Su6 TaxID=1520810 RepID=UPI00089F0A48|nr:hypothetical protein [Butyrivibrio sp. Su6]SEG15170.1 hypothetical protein SAMN02910276_01994 [Butyrivibrio sp. Su6]
MLKKNRVLIIIGAQLLFLLVLTLVLHSMKTKEIDLGFQDWTSEYMTNDGEYLYLMDEYVNSGEELAIMTQPNIQLDAGSYTLSVTYYVEDDQSLEFSTQKPKQIKYINAGTVRLSKYINEVVYHFDVTEHMDEFNVQFDYNGNGTFEIDRVTLSTSNGRFYRGIIYIALIMLLADLYFFWFKNLESSKKINVVLVMGICFVVSLPLTAHGTYYGHDVLYHITRVEALANEFRNGSFPVRMSSLWNYGWGYSSSVLYGDYLLYPAAFLRMFYFDTTTCFKFLVFYMNLIVTVVSYFSFKHIFKNNRIALILSLAYVTCGYRLTDLYVRYAIGESSGILFTPMVAAGLFGIYTETQENNKKKNMINVILFGGGFAAISCSHVITTEMITITLLILILILFKRTITWPVIKLGLFSLVLCLGISAFYLVPFMEYFVTLPLLVNASYIQEYLLGLQDSGVTLAELFGFFKNPMGDMEIGGLAGKSLFSPGILLMGALVVAIFLVLRNKSNKKINIMLIISLVILWIASPFFPWNYMAAHFGWFIIVSQVQFAYRFTEMALIPLTLLLGFILEKYFEDYSVLKNESEISWPRPQNLIIGLMLVALLWMGWYISDYIGNYNELYFYDTAEIDVAYAVDGGEYLLEHIDHENLYPYYRTEGLNSFVPVSRDGYKFDVQVEVGNEEGYVDFPLYNYTYYTAFGDNGEKFEVVNGDENSMVRAILPAGYSGHVYVDFIEPIHWHIAEMITIISAIAIMVIYYREFKKR